jgi:hypothetical protein
MKSIYIPGLGKTAPFPAELFLLACATLHLALQPTNEKASYIN